MLVTLSTLFITGGQVIAYAFGYLLAQKEHGWRWMVGLGAVPAIFQFGLLLLLPETPRWLVQAGNDTGARNVLRKVYASDTNIAAEHVLQAIKREIIEEEATSKLLNPAASRDNAFPWLTQFRYRTTELLYVGGNRRALVLACMLQGLQQLCGFVRPLLLLSWSFTKSFFRIPSCTSRPPSSLSLASHPRS